MRRLLLLPLLAVCACLGPTDDESQVLDLRVLAGRFDPPELMAPPCNLLADGGLDACLITAAPVFAQPVKMTWLIEDPHGAGRSLRYRVIACANQSDFKCENAGDFQQLMPPGGGYLSTDAGELTLNLTPALALVAAADGGLQPLLLEVQSQDTYKGFGGLRMPIVIDVQGRASDGGFEEVFSQKLMVYNLQVFPEMKANVNPELPGIVFLDGGVWRENDRLQLQGRPDAGFKMEPLSFADRQETYVVPSFELKPLTLRESWKISWAADLGKFSPTETGGTGFNGEDSRHRVTWVPRGADTTEADVTFWFIARDGRGGESWITRTAHWTP